MSRRDLSLFALLAAVWGASYMFIKIGLDHGLGPAAIVVLRTALAALVLFPIAGRMGVINGLRSRLGTIAILAAMQVAGPFLLISAGEQDISSSLAGILVSAAPIFTFLLTYVIARDERPSRTGLAGVAIGIVGVVLLLGIDVGGSGNALVGGLAVVLASFGYAVGAYYMKRNLADVQPVSLVAATMGFSALFALPFVALDAPEAWPGIGTGAAILALGVLGTGLAFVIFYDLIAKVGAAHASLVAYIAPGFAVLYGVALLGEDFTLATAAGLVLIVGGSWMAAERGLPRRLRRERRRPAGHTPQRSPDRVSA